MTLAELLASVGPAVLAGAAAAWAMARAFGEKAVDHAFESRLAQTRDALARETALAEAGFADRLRRETELVLGDAASDRAYRFDARKRLYTAIGPLRFQLIQAAILFRGRMLSHAAAETPYTLDFAQPYYAASFLYRLGRLLGLTELIERQIAIHDFSVDADMMRLVRFRTALFDALSGPDAALDHPALDWSEQKEHLYRDTIQTMAVSMMPKDEARVVRFDEFQHMLQQYPAYMEPLKSLVARLDRSRTPVLWLRLCAMAALCDGLVADDPVADALGAGPADLSVLLARSEDVFLVGNRDRGLAMLAAERARIAARASAGEN